MSNIRRRPSRKPFIWVENKSEAMPTYLRNEADVEKDFGNIDSRNITKRPPLYCLSIMKVVDSRKVESQFYKSGYVNVNYEKVDKSYTFNSAALYRIAYSQAKHYRELIGGGKIEVAKSKVCNIFTDVYGTWSFRIYDKEGNKRYYITTEPVCRFCIQPMFKKQK